MRVQLFVLLWFVVGAVQAAEWEIKPSPLMTTWGESIHPESVWMEYPRPQMVRRDNWVNLNGLWDYAIVSREGGETKPEAWKGKILVPFAAESPLSGVKEWVRPHQYLWYKRSLTVNKQADRTMLKPQSFINFSSLIMASSDGGVNNPSGHQP